MHSLLSRFVSSSICAGWDLAGQIEHTSSRCPSPRFLVIVLRREQKRSLMATGFLLSCPPPTPPTFVARPPPCGHESGRRSPGWGRRPDPIRTPQAEDHDSGVIGDRQWQNTVWAFLTEHGAERAGRVSSAHAGGPSGRFAPPLDGAGCSGQAEVCVGLGDRLSPSYADGISAMATPSLLRFSAA